MLYAIYEENFPIVEKKLNRIAKKCLRHGNDFTFKILNEEIRERKNFDTKQMEYFKFFIVEVEGTAKIDNWECIAILENHNEGNVIRRINTEIEVPERFKFTKNICEHCNSKRQRNQLYIIHNTETDEWKQVGGNCLLLYTSGLNMEYVTAYLDGIIELEENDGVIIGSGKPYYSVKNVLSYATEIIDKTGYFNANSTLPTKDLLITLMCNRFDIGIKSINSLLYAKKFDISFDRNDFEKESTEEKVKNIIDYYLSLNSSNEFIHNVQVLLKEEYVSSKDFGFLCYLPQGYAKHIQKETERAKKKEIKSEFYGEVGKRYKDVKIEFIELISSWTTQYGVMSVYRIIIDNGVLIWKTTNQLFLEDGEKFDTITFTVKEHKEYKEEKQTEVTRCKVTIK